MTAEAVGYTALVRRWEGRWEVYLLDPDEGLIGSTTALTLGEVEHVARAFLAEHLRFSVPAHQIRITVIRT